MRRGLDDPSFANAVQVYLAAAAPGVPEIVHGQMDLLPDAVLGPAALEGMPATVVSPFERLTESGFALRMRGGRRVPFPNGYTLVQDQRPAGQEDKPIPPVPFTGYFQRRLVPYASGVLSDHDCSHAAAYQELLSNTEFAEFVWVAASNAGTNIGPCRKFTGAIDKFSDAHILLTKGDGPSELYDPQRYVDQARNCLGRLIELQTTTAVQPDGIPNAVESDLFGSLWSQTGFAVCELEVNQIVEARAQGLAAYVPWPIWNGGQD